MEFLKIKALVEATCYAGTDNVSRVNETLKSLLGMMIPEVGEAEERRTQKMRTKLDKLKTMGDISIRPMDEGGFRRKPSKRREED